MATEQYGYREFDYRLRLFDGYLDTTRTTLSGDADNSKSIDDRIAAQLYEAGSKRSERYHRRQQLRHSGAIPDALHVWVLNPGDSSAVPLPEVAACTPSARSKADYRIIVIGQDFTDISHRCDTHLQAPETNWRYHIRRSGLRSRRIASHEQFRDASRSLLSSIHQYYCLSGAVPTPVMEATGSTVSFRGDHCPLMDGETFYSNINRERL